MAILATVFGLVGRFTGKLLTMSLGWASLLLFGRVPKDREVFLAAITFGSVIWVVLIVGVAVPAAGVWLLSFAPIPDWVDEGLVRLAMLAAVLVLPPVLSLATLKLLRTQDRPKGIGPILLHLARGYPLAAGLALLLVFLGIIGLVRKVASLARRWTDTHIPIVVKPGGYEQLAADLDQAISDAGIDIEPRDAPAVMVVPGRLLATVAGTSVRGLLPDRLVRLVGKDVEVLIYPSDVAISGKQRSPPPACRRRSPAGSPPPRHGSPCQPMPRRSRTSSAAWPRTVPLASERAEALAEIDHQPGHRGAPVRRMGGPLPAAPAGRA